MNKLKKIWRENSVLFVLFFILIACLVAIGVVVVTYFVGDTSGKHGDRNAEAAEYPFEQEQIDEIIAKLKVDETILDVKIRKNEVRTIYITFYMDAKVPVVEAESKALLSLELFDEKTLSYYDLQYSLIAEKTEENEGYKRSGSHNANGTGGISWINNTVFETEEENEE